MVSSRVSAVGDWLVVVSESGQSDVFSVSERPCVAGEGRRRRVAVDARTTAVQQRVVATERLSEVFDARRVDEVVHCTVGVQQQTNRRPASAISYRSIQLLQYRFLNKNMHANI